MRLSREPESPSQKQKKAEKKVKADKKRTPWNNKARVSAQ
jgi:hypothetical protein